jgi:hypothetical protein
LAAIGAVSGVIMSMNTRMTANVVAKPIAWFAMVLYPPVRWYRTASSV